MEVHRCAVEAIVRWHPELFLELHTAAAVAVLSQFSPSPASFEVECSGLDSRGLHRADGFRLELTWSRKSEDKARRLRATMQSKPLVEAAAIAVAMVLIHEVVPLGPLDVTEYGDRADYRSLASCRVLEISGTQRAAEFGRRHREKVAQARNNPLGWDAYVIVCLFAASGHRVRFSGHRWADPEHVENKD